MIPIFITQQACTPLIQAFNLTATVHVVIDLPLIILQVVSIEQACQDHQEVGQE